MKTLKANNYQQALMELKKLSKKELKKVTEDIKYEDRKHYHVVRVEIIDRSGEETNKVMLTISKHHPNGFEKFKKNYQQLGINRIVVLHDPTLLKEDEVKTVPTHQRESIVAKATRELKEQHKEEVDALVAEGIQKALAEKEESGSGDGNQPSKTEIFYQVYEEIMKKGATVDQIELFAKEYKIELVKDDNKAKKQELIKKWFDNMPQTNA